MLIHPSKYDWKKDRVAIDAFVWKVIEALHPKPSTGMASNSRPPSPRSSARSTIRHSFTLSPPLCFACSLTCDAYIVIFPINPQLAIGTAIFANIGNGMAALQHELITSYNYEPRDSIVDALKLLNSLCTIITLAGIITPHYCFVLFKNISM